MTRRIVYGISLWVFLGAAACTIASIALPNWISYSSPTDGSDPIRVTYGLHKRCSSITGKCTPFPEYEDCHGDDRWFCSIWRSTGFFMNFSIVLQLACVIAYLTVLVGGRSSREAGWKMVAGLLSIVALGEIISMAMVVCGLTMLMQYALITDGYTGVSVRARQPILRRLGAGQVLRSVHRQLGGAAPQCCWCGRRCDVSAAPRRL